MNNAAKAFLQITLQVDPGNRAAAAKVYTTYRTPFLNTVEGAVSKQLLVRPEDVQVLHGFSSVETAQGYLESRLFAEDVVKGLAPLLKAAPDVKIYSAE